MHFSQFSIETILKISNVFTRFPIAYDFRTKPKNLTQALLHFVKNMTK